jgi:GLPGLI family protein
MNTYKTISLFIILFSLCQFSFAQDVLQGKITYKGKLRQFNDDKKSSLNYLDELIKDEDTLYFQLLFKGAESTFKMEKKLQKGNNIELSKTFLGGKNTYYYNKNSKPFYRTRAYGELFLIDYEIPKWTLTKDSKKIGKYTCYKATTVYTVRNSKGIFKHPVTVWYTNEIPVSFGPKSYHGLPGLILELLEKNKLYVASTIQLNATNITIKKPTKGMKKTQEEFENIGIKMDEERSIRN